MNAQSQRKGRLDCRQAEMTTDYSSTVVIVVTGLEGISETVGDRWHRLRRQRRNGPQNWFKIWFESTYSGEIAIHQSSHAAEPRAEERDVA